MMNKSMIFVHSIRVIVLIFFLSGNRFFYRSTESRSFFNSTSYGLYNTASRISYSDSTVDNESDIIFDAKWTSSNILDVISVAAGDVEQDGDMDIAVLFHYSFYQQAIGLYTTDNGELSSSYTWVSMPFTGTRSLRADKRLQWIDYDNDGDFDLSAGNQLYRNDNTILTLYPIWEGMENSTTGSIAWGDMDGDGDLDLATNQQIYRNNNGTLIATLTLNGSYSCQWCESLNWIDVDHDGDLDLHATNNIGDFGLIFDAFFYENVDGQLQTPVQKEGEGGISSESGDINKDGFTDIVTSNGGESYFGYPGNGRIAFYQNNTMGIFSKVWETISGHGTALRLADIDNDNDLDIIAGSSHFNLNTGLIRIYKNNQGIFSLVADWESTLRDYIVSIDVADFDSDGDLDLIAAGRGYLRLYTNISANQTFTKNQQFFFSDYDVPPENLESGDIDKDKDQDIVIDYHWYTRYLNNNGQLIQSNISDDNYDKHIILGDIDNDDYLELFHGNKMYKNNQGTLDNDYDWYGSDCSTKGILVDINKDGYGDYSCLSQNNILIFQNHFGVLNLSPDLFNLTIQNPISLFWADIDNDGDMDPSIVQHNSSIKIFNNDNGNIKNETLFISNEIYNNYYTDLSWGDMDSDGDLDLAVGEQSARVYRNDNGTINSNPIWKSANTYGFTDLDWGDVDNDGDLDLAATAHIFINNNGILDTIPAIDLTQGRPSSDSTWTDLDNDGTLDFVSIIPTPPTTHQNSGVNLTTFFNRTWNDNQATTLPNIHLDVAHALTYSSSQGGILDQGTITITYTASHLQSLPIHRIKGQYSLNGGGQWFDAIPTPNTPTENISTSTQGISHYYTWDVINSGIMGQYDNVVFRLVAIPVIVNRINKSAPRYQYPSKATTSRPFRIRGNQIRVVDQHGVPQKGSVVYRKPLNESNSLKPYTSLKGELFQTDQQGYLQGRGTIAVGDVIVAMSPISSTSNFKIYATNAVPTPIGITGTTVTQLGVQTLVVSASNPLMLLNLDVALEWDARQDTTYLTNLNYQLQRTAELLYDWTDGQVTLGQIRIFHDRDHWDDAHIRIYATNRLRPNAAQGGIVTTPISDPLRLTIAYDPGQVRMGAIWNRYGDPTSTLTDDWARTLAHELGHYALFLDDNYLGLDSQGRLINVDSCPGAMADPYRTDYYSEFHPASGWLPACAQTLSQHETGRADWQTIQTFYPWLHGPTVPITATNPGPSRLPLAVTTIREQIPLTPTTTLPVPIFYLVTADGARYQPSPAARAFLFHNTQVTDVGQPTLDQVTARGARSGDRLCVFDLAADHSGCAGLSATEEHLVMSPAPNWHPQLVVTPITSRTLTLSVTAIPANQPLWAQVFPADAPATAPITLTAVPGGATATVTLPDIALDGIIHLWIDEPGARREVVADYAIGGNPGHRRARIGHRRARITPVLSPDGQALLFGPELALREGEFYTLQAATNLPAVPPWATTVGTGYWLSGSPTAPSLQGSSLSVSYLGNALAADDEQWLRLHHWDGQRWQPLDTTVDTYYNTAVAPTVGPGLYALFASVELPLPTAGWNLLAYPAATAAVTTALQSIADKYTMVYGYEPMDMVDPWKVYAPAAPAWVNDLQELAFGRGYWVYTTQPVTVHVPLGSSGRLVPDTTTAQQTGQLPPMTVYGYVTATQGVTPTVGMEVEATIGGQRCGATRVRAVPGGIGYVLAVEAAGGSVLGCGMLGQPVTVRVVTETLLGAVTPWDHRRVWSLDVHGAPYTAYLPLIQR